MEDAGGERSKSVIGASREPRDVVVPGPGLSPPHGRVTRQGGAAAMELLGRAGKGDSSCTTRRPRSRVGVGAFQGGILSSTGCDRGFGFGKVHINDDISIYI